MGATVKALKVLGRAALAADRKLTDSANKGFGMTGLEPVRTTYRKPCPKCKKRYRINPDCGICGGTGRMR